MTGFTIVELLVAELLLEEELVEFGGLIAPVSMSKNALHRFTQKVRHFSLFNVGSGLHFSPQSEMQKASSCVAVEVL